MEPYPPTPTCPTPTNVECLDLVYRDSSCGQVHRDVCTAAIQNHFWSQWNADSTPVTEGLPPATTIDSRISTGSSVPKNRLRSERRKRRAVLVEDLLAEADPDIDAILAAVDREPLPDWVLERGETQELVGATLSSLPP